MALTLCSLLFAPCVFNIISTWLYCVGFPFYWFHNNHKPPSCHAAHSFFIRLESPGCISTQLHLQTPPNLSSSVHLECKYGKGVAPRAGVGLPDLQFRADRAFGTLIILVHVLCFSHLTVTTDCVKLFRFLSAKYTMSINLFQFLL